VRALAKRYFEAVSRAVSGHSRVALDPAGKNAK
jgi:hypothetical protein